MQIGDYQVNSVLTGFFRLDGGSMFGSVPKVLWEKTNPADEKNRIKMAARALLVRGQGRNILVDCGIGQRWTPKEADRFGIDHTTTHLEKGLAEHGLKPGDITDVIMTHLHFDHMGGATSQNDKGEVELTFPNATHVIHQDNLNQSIKSTAKDRASFIQALIEPVSKTGKLKVLSEAVEYLPGVFTMISNGHTPGQQLVRVTDGKTTVLFCSDLIPTASHIPLPYVMAYDLYPVTTMEEKRQVLENAADEGWILAWVHDPDVSACTAKFEKGKYSRDRDIEL